LMSATTQLEDMLEESIPKFEDIETTPLPHENPTLKGSQEELVISLHALSIFSTPRTLNLIGYIKHRKVIVLVGSVRTHNIIHKCVAKKLHCYVYAISNFQIMIANGV